MHIIEAMRKANIGRPLSEATRAKLSAIRKRLGMRPPKAGKPWEEWEDHLLRTLPAGEVAAKTGRTLTAVYSRRNLLRLPDARRNSPCDTSPSSPKD